MQLSNWNNYPKVDAAMAQPRQPQEVQQVLEQPQTIARGLGRSYGDASLGPHMTSSLGLNRFLHFNRESGLIRCQSGVSLAEVLEVAMPKGWFLPVTPGTKFVTIGGAIAADVHGKNHHREGSISQWVREVKLLTAAGEVLILTPEQQPELFWATMGGMGLTGIVLEAVLQLKPVESAWIRQQTFKAKNLEGIFRHFEEQESWTYTVSWIDCLARGRNLGRSVLMVGEHAMVDELPQKARKQPLKVPGKLSLSIPFPFPPFVLSNVTIKAFNITYYAKHRHLQRSIIPYEPFFYPLDSISHWNRMYGSRGFLQYQFVLPLESSFEGLKEVLELISKAKRGSFLAVLKLFGEQGPGLLSFPMRGYTLALDFPLEPSLFPFLDRLDEVVLKWGGRLYMAKDARMKSRMLNRGYPQVEEFRQVLQQVDPERKFRSFLSQRVEL